jgi:hypothetical protein
MKLTESSLRQLIRQVIREADESDKYTHIGYGKYKEKGKEKDKDAETFKKTDSGKFEPFGDKEGGEKEKPKPKAAKIAADPFADKDSETGDDEADWPEDDPRWDVPPEPDDLKDILDGFGKTDVYSNSEVSNEMIGEFDFEDNKVTYSNSNFEDLDDWNLAKDVLGPLKKAGIKYKKYKDEYSAGVIVNTEDLESLIEILKQTVGNKEINTGGGYDEDEDDWTPSLVKYDEEEMSAWAKSKPPEFQGAVADTVSDVAKHDPKDDPYNVINKTGNGGELNWDMADELTKSTGEHVDSIDIPIYKEVEYIAKHGTTPEKMKDLFKTASTGAREYWYLKLGLRSPEELDSPSETDFVPQANRLPGKGAYYRPIPPSFEPAPPDWENWDVKRHGGDDDWMYKPSKESKKVKDVDYNEKEMEEWVDKGSTRGVLATSSRDTLAKVAKYDPKANPRDIMNSRPGGLLVWDMAKGKDVEADTIPLYKEIEYMAKASDEQPEKMKDLFRKASTGAKEYWYVQLGLRHPEDLPPDRTFVEPDDEDVDDWDVDHKSGDKYYDTAPPSFKESITSQLKKEFKQYGFTQKSKNWKRIMI